MTVEQMVKMACSYAGVSLSELARRIGFTPQNLHQRLVVGKLTVAELEKIASALGGEYTFGIRFPDGTTI